ncbi:MAG: FAD-dependent oxidoreductase, partial [Actinomycetota bacterium]
IAHQMVASLAPGTVHLGCSVVKVEPGRVMLGDGRSVEASAVVVATEAPIAARLLQRPHVTDRGSLAVGCVWFEAPSSPVSQRLIVLDGTRSGPALNVAVMSNVAPEYVTVDAPVGRSLVAAACPGVDLSTSDDLDARVRSQLRGWWGPVVDQWRVLRVDRIAHGQPMAAPPFVAKRGQSLGEGLWVCGDHRDTPSIQGALFSGRRCGESVAEALS